MVCLMFCTAEVVSAALGRMSEFISPQSAVWGSGNRVGVGVRIAQDPESLQDLVLMIGSGKRDKTVYTATRKRTDCRNARNPTPSLAPSPHR